MNTQCKTIVKALLKNKEIKWWSAREFQSGIYFVGYEATARISDLLNMYPSSFLVAKDGRYRVIAVNWENEQGIKDLERFIGEENEY